MQQIRLLPGSRASCHGWGITRSSITARQSRTRYERAAMSIVVRITKRYSPTRAVHCGCGTVSATPLRSRYVSQDRSSAPHCRCPVPKTSRRPPRAWPPNCACESCLSSLKPSAYARNDWQSSTPKRRSGARRNASVTRGSVSGCAMPCAIRHLPVWSDHQDQTRIRRRPATWTHQTPDQITNADVSARVSGLYRLLSRCGCPT